MPRPIGDVPEGEAREFNVGGREIVLCNVEGEFYALQGMCTHEELPLDGGEVDGTSSSATGTAPASTCAPAAPRASPPPSPCRPSRRAWTAAASS